MMDGTPRWIVERLTRAERLRLFLDYDGTLADFAPTPDHVLPDPSLIALLTRLAARRCIQTTVISGRRLAHVRQLVPVPGIFLAGTYGVELETPRGERLDRVPFEAVRPALEQTRSKLPKHWAGSVR